MYFGRRLVIGCLFTYMKILSVYVIMLYFATSILQSLSIILLALWQHFQDAWNKDYVRLKGCIKVD